MRMKYFLLLFWVFGLYFCGNGTSQISRGGEVVISVTSTFHGNSLNNIPVTFECVGFTYEAKTQGGISRVQLDDVKTCNIKINFANSQATKNENYIPAVIEETPLTGGENIEIDLAERNILNPNGQYRWKDLLDAYRGRDHIDGVNQVWTNQPSRWVVFDPNRILKGYPDPKNNPLFENIMAGFRAIEEYTNGFIQAPSRDEVEIRYTEEKFVNFMIAFVITDGEKWELDVGSTGGDILRSGAATDPGDGKSVIEMLTASVQGGDNKGNVGVFNSGEIKPIDKTWGRFNYFKRKPGDKFYLNGPYGHLYEVRKIE